MKSIFAVVRDLISHPYGIHHAWEISIKDEDKLKAARQIKDWLKHRENALIGNHVLFDQRGVDGVCPIRIYCKPHSMNLTKEQQWELHDFFFSYIIVKVPRYMSNDDKTKLAPTWRQLT